MLIVFVEVRVDILMRHSLSWRERIVFLGIFDVFLSQCGHNWHKHLEFQNTLRSTVKKWLFAFQIYNRIQEQLSECKEFKNWFICIISEHSEKYFYRKLFLIIFKYQHSGSRFAQQQNKEKSYIQNLANLLFDQHQQINKTKINF